jgi:dehydrogenase/reductase SDR family member 7B
MHFKNKLILITGASSGLGKELSSLFINEGGLVALVGRNREKLLNIEKEFGNKSKHFIFDLSSYQNFGKIVDDIQIKFQKNIDVIVNAAGIGILGPVKDVPIEEYNKIMNINFLSPVNIIKETLKYSSSLKIIINITSGVGYYSLPNSSPYSSSKSALNAVTESLSVELEKENIHVFQVNPGLINTNFKKSIIKYGDFKNDYTNGHYRNTKIIALRIISDIKRGKKIINYSFRLKLFKIFYSIAPTITVYFLKKFLI